MEYKAKIKSLLSVAKKEVESIPKSIWVAGTVIPFGYVAVTAYWAGKKIYSTVKKDKKDDSGESSS